MLFVAQYQTSAMPAVFGEPTTEGVSSSDTMMMTIESVFQRYPGSLLDRRFIPVALRFNEVIMFIWLIVGLIGNTLSAIVWLMRRMRRNNSSAVYVAALSINCDVFLVMFLLDSLNVLFDVTQLQDVHVGCQVFCYGQITENFHLIFFVKVLVAN